MLKHYKFNDVRLALAKTLARETNTTPWTGIDDAIRSAYMDAAGKAVRDVINVQTSLWPVKHRYPARLVASIITTRFIQTGLDKCELFNSL